jgi:hypothetical protein
MINEMRGTSPQLAHKSRIPISLGAADSAETGATEGD